LLSPSFPGIKGSRDKGSMPKLVELASF